MSETATLESSTIEAPMEVSRGPLVNLTPDQRKDFRTTGTLPKSEVAATSLETPGESGTPKRQDKPKNEPKPKQTAEERIAELERSIAYIKKGAGLDKPKADSMPAKSEVPDLSAKPTPDDKNADGTPKWKTLEEYEDAVLDWKFEQREAKKAEAAAEAARLEDLNAKVEKARSRHGDIDAVIQTTAKDILEDQAISPAAKRLIGKSEMIGDLLFTIGGDKATLAKFKAMPEDQAIRYVVLTETLIAQELEAKSAETVAEPPAKLKTQAPKPPAEAGGRAATPPDSMQAALEGSGGKLNAGLKAEFLRRDLAKLRG
jgi:hypothetical protein